MAARPASLALVDGRRSGRHFCPLLPSKSVNCSCDSRTCLLGHGIRPTSRKCFFLSLSCSRKKKKREILLYLVQGNYMFLRSPISGRERPPVGFFLLCVRDLRAHAGPAKYGRPCTLVGFLKHDGEEIISKRLSLFFIAPNSRNYSASRIGTARAGALGVKMAPFNSVVKREKRRSRSFFFIGRR